MNNNDYVYVTTVDEKTKNYALSALEQTFQKYIKDNKDPFVKEFLLKHSEELSKDMLAAQHSSFNIVDQAPYKVGVLYKGRLEREEYVLFTERHICNKDFDIVTDPLEFFQFCKIMIKVKDPKGRLNKNTGKTLYKFYPNSVRLTIVTEIKEDEIVSSILDSVKLTKNDNFKRHISKKVKKAFRKYYKVN